MCPEGWDPRTKTKLGFLAHLADIEGSTCLTEIWKGAKEFKKFKKIEKHCMESWCVM
jgi:hypothetical protein